jgi:hypothetical protein
MAPSPPRHRQSFLHALRQPGRRRAWALLLASVLLFASLVHVSHAHEGSVSPSPHKFCVACAVLDRSGGGAPPPHVASLEAPRPTADRPPNPDAEAARVAVPLRSPCCPRAPPPSLHA